MTPTIAIIGHNGNVGKTVVPHLIKAHGAGQIKLIVLHRPSSAIGSIPGDVERRVIKDTETKSLQEVVKGINVMLSTIGPEGYALQQSILEALQTSPDIVTFIPAHFGAVWTEEMLQKPMVRAFHGSYDHLYSSAKEYGISLTQIRAGIFLPYTFMGNAVGLDAEANKIELYKDARNKSLHISEFNHLAAVIANVVLRDTSSIANKNYYTYTFSPTGQELIDLFTKLNGAEPTVDEYTDEQYERDTDVPGLPLIGATYRKRWGEGVWGWDSIDAEWVDVEDPKGTLHELAKPLFAY